MANIFVYVVLVSMILILTRVVTVDFVFFTNVLVCFSLCFLCFCIEGFVCLTGYWKEEQALVPTLDNRHSVNTGSVDFAVLFDCDVLLSGVHYFLWAGFLLQ